MKFLIRIWSGTGVLLLSLLFFLAIGEGYFRIVKLSPDNDDRFFEPYLMGGDLVRSHAPELPADFGYEKRGLFYYYPFHKPIHSMADRNFLQGSRIEIPANAKRVYVLGGSVAYGVGASDETHMWWRLLETRLRHDLRDPAITVVPMGMHSWSSTQERLALELFVFSEHPAAVVFVDGGNDVGVPAMFVRPGDPYNMGVLYSRYYSATFQTLRAISNYSAMVRYALLQEIDRGFDHYYLERLSHPEEMENAYSSVVSLYLDNVQWMAKRCAQESVPCQFFVQPLKEVTRRYMDSKIPMNGELTMYRRILSRSKTAALHDLSHLLDQHLEYYVDNIHFGDPGQELLAQAIGRELTRVLKP